MYVYLKNTQILGVGHTLIEDYTCVGVDEISYVKLLDSSEYSNYSVKDGVLTRNVPKTLVKETILLSQSKSKDVHLVFSDVITITLSEKAKTLLNKDDRLKIFSIDSIFSENFYLELFLFPDVDTIVPVPSIVNSVYITNYYLELEYSYEIINNGV